jgi:hypothetical protein
MADVTLKPFGRELLEVPVTKYDVYRGALRHISSLLNLLVRRRFHRIGARRVP